MKKELKLVNKDKKKSKLGTRQNFKLAVEMWNKSKI